jgi:hypothetical protein
MLRVLLLAFGTALVGGCDIFREAYYQRTGKSEGTLVANIGMPLEEVEQRSTLKLSDGFHAPSGEVQKSAQAVFDLELAGTGVRLERCRQYFLFTRRDDSRLESIVIYATPSDWTWAQVEAVGQSTRQKLSAAGWTPGHFVYHTPELQALHAGAAAGDGDYWLKDDVLFQIDPRPTETQLVGSDPHAGQFTLYYRIQPMRWDDHPHLEFPGRERPTPSVEPTATLPKPPRQ